MSSRDPFDEPQRIALVVILALLADAVESMAVIPGAAVICGGLRYGRRSPGQEDSFGQGKARGAGRFGAITSALAFLGLKIAQSTFLAT